MSVPLLSLSGVTKDFRRRTRWAWRPAGIRAVDQVSLDLISGEIVGVVGASGAGTTTLLRLAGALLAPDAGTVRLGGVPLDRAAARRFVGWAPDAPVFPPTLTVREVLDYLARFHAPAPARRALVSAGFEIGGLEPVAGRRTGLLSRAWLHRLALAQAALGRRRVLLLDQTLSSVDAVARRSLAERLAALAARGMAILIAAHDLSVLERVASRVIVLHNGVVARAGSLATLIGERVLEVVLDQPPASVPPGFRLTAMGLETDLARGSVEAALAVCRAHRLAVRASRVRVKSLEDVLLETWDAAPR